jgi:hypothetical protein
VKVTQSKFRGFSRQSFQKSLNGQRPVRIPDDVPDVILAQLALDRTSLLPRVRQIVAGRIAQHVQAAGGATAQRAPRLCLKVFRNQAKKLSKEERPEIARVAVKARWEKWRSEHPETSYKSKGKSRAIETSERSNRKSGSSLSDVRIPIF